MKLLLVVAIVVGSATARAENADPFVRVATSHARTCAVRASGAVACMTAEDQVLRPFAGLTNVDKLAIDPFIACAVKRDKKVACVAFDPKVNKITVPAIDNAVDVAVLDYGIVCAVRKADRPQCFNAYEPTKKLDDAYPKTTRQISKGENHWCALLDGGGVHCWGSNGRGQLGIRAPRGKSAADDIVPDGPAGGARAQVSGASAVAAASEHTCAIVKGAVKCWGTHYQGALGQGDRKIEAGKVVTVPGISDAVEIDAFAWTTCVRTRSGDAICWGTNTHGELGDKTLENRTSPVKLAIGKVKDLSLGHQRTCAVLADGNVACWGELERKTPAKVPGLARVTSLSAANEATCARTADGATRCWGRMGRLVEKAAFGYLATPTHMKELDPLRELRITSDDFNWRACGIVDGGVACSMLPPGGGDVFELAARKRSINRAKLAGVPSTITLRDGGPCASTTSGVHCVQANASAKETFTIVPVPSLANAKALVAEFGWVCGITSTGGVACVGQPTKTYSELALALSGKAVPVPGIKNAVSLAIINRTVCAIDKAGSVTCFEYNANEQQIVFTKKIDGLSDAVSLTTAGQPCAVRRTGAIVCFDLPSAPSEGETIAPTKLTPVPGITDATQIAAGFRHTCVLHRDGTVSCWGSNQYGQLGDGRGAGHSWIVPTAPK